MQMINGPGSQKQATSQFKQHKTKIGASFREQLMKIGVVRNESVLNGMINKTEEQLKRDLKTTKIPIGRAKSLVRTLNTIK